MLSTFNLFYLSYLMLNVIFVLFFFLFKNNLSFGIMIESKFINITRIDKLITVPFKLCNAKNYIFFSTLLKWSSYFYFF